MLFAILPSSFYPEYFWLLLSCYEFLLILTVSFGDDFLIRYLFDSVKALLFSGGSVEQDGLACQGENLDRGNLSPNDSDVHHPPFSLTENKISTGHLFSQLIILIHNNHPGRIFIDIISYIDI